MDEGPFVIGILIVLFVVAYTAWRMINYCLNGACILVLLLLFVAMVVILIDCFFGQKLSKMALMQTRDVVHMANSTWTIMQNMMPAIMKTYRAMQSN